MVKSYPQNNDYKPGTWKGVVDNTGKRISASFTCPNCGELGSLSAHHIAPDGTVTPSLICPYECGFHEHIKLEGWAQINHGS